ncbi:MAG: alpha/beta fold hydrolase [Flaviflexus sp.]|nr:alpha/beta fold hydrolase [Flaviflexus sp.]
MNLAERIRDYAWMIRQFVTAPFVRKLPDLPLGGDGVGQAAGRSTTGRATGAAVAGTCVNRGGGRTPEGSASQENHRARPETAHRDSPSPETAGVEPVSPVPIDLPRIVFLPGIYEANEYVRPLAQAFQAAGYPVSSGYLGKRTRAPVAELATELLARLDKVGPVILLGHSKGGLIGRAALARSEQILGLITVATPWRGSILARPFPRFTALGRLAPGGADSARTWSMEREMGIRRRIFSIRPASDPHIPAATDLDGAHNIVVPASGHFRPLAHPATIRAALDAAAELISRRA